MSREYEGGRNVVEEYLRRRGYAESSGARRYLQALRSSVMSLYEVSDVVPGQSFLARDLIRDLQSVRVMEVRGTRALKQWDRIGARLIPEHSEWRMAGGVLLFERSASDFLVETLRSIDGKLPDDLRKIAIEKHGREAAASIDKELAEAPPLAMMAPTFASIWLADALDRVLNPQIPELINRDGHALVLCTSRFQFLEKVSASTCRKALADVPDLVEAGIKLFNWIGAAGNPTAPPITSADRPSIALMTASSSGETILGSVEIKKDAVELATNSRERATKGSKCSLMRSRDWWAMPHAKSRAPGIYSLEAPRVRSGSGMARQKFRLRLRAPLFTPIWTVTTARRWIDRCPRSETSLRVRRRDPTPAGPGLSVGSRTWRTTPPGQLVGPILWRATTSAGSGTNSASPGFERSLNGC